MRVKRRRPQSLRRITSERSTRVLETLEERRLLTADLQLVADIREGTTGSSIADLTVLGDSLYFTANDGGRDTIWRHVPSTNTTEKLLDPVSGQPVEGYDLRAFQGQLVYGGVIGSEGLWQYDPSADAISQLSTIYAAQATVVGDTIFFRADDGNVGEELWRYDAGGTVSLVADLDGTPDPSNIDRLIPGTDELYFWAQFNLDDDTFGVNSLYEVDALTGVISQVFTVDYEHNGEPPHNMVEDTAVAGGRAYFPYLDHESTAPAFNIELGMEYGSYFNINDFDVVLDQFSYSNDGSLGYTAGEPYDLTVVGDKLYFTASRTIPQFEGMDENGDLVPVDDTGIPLDPDYPFAITDYYLVEGREFRGIVELDPTNNNFNFVVGELESPDDPPTFDIGYGADHLTAVDDKLVFMDSGLYGNGGLWSYDPATGSTEQLLDYDDVYRRTGLGAGSIAAFGSTLYLSYSEPDTGQELYVLSEATPPTANAGGPYTSPEGSNFTLDATGSFDAETPNEALLFEWDLNFDASNFDVDASGAQPTVTFADDFASRTIALRVTDPSGLSEVATTTLEITNAAPVINSLPDVTGQVGQAIAFTVHATDPGTNDVLTYSWDFGEGAPQSGVALTAPLHTYNSAGTYNGSLTVTDDSGASVQQAFLVVVAEPVTFTIAAQAVDESVGTVTATVALDAAATSPITIPYTVGGTANAADHDLADGTVTIAAGESSAQLVINLADDLLDEADTESIIITLGTPVGASLGEIATHTISVHDNDAKPIAFLSTPFIRLEEEFGAAVDVSIQLDAVSGRDVTVPFALAGSATLDSDYSIESQTLVIPAGQQQASTTITLINDVTPEPAEIIQVSLLSSNEAGLPNGGTQPATQIITIAQNDQPQVWFNYASFVRKEGNGDVPQYGPRIRVSKPSDAPINVPFTVSGDTEQLDIVPASGVLTIPAGSYAGVLEYHIIDDEVAEPYKSITIDLDAPTGAVLGPVTSTTIGLFDDDIPSISLSTPSPLERFESAGDIPLQIRLDRTPVIPIEFDLEVANSSWGAVLTQGVDYLIVDGAGNQVTGLGTIGTDETEVTYYLRLLDDDLHESTERLRLKLEPKIVLMESFEPSVQRGDNTELEFSIRDNDPWFRPFTADSSVNEDAGTASFGVELVGDSESPVTITYDVTGSANRGSDYTLPGPNSFTLNAGESATRTINIIDDGLDEPLETVRLEFASDDADAWLVSRSSGLRADSSSMTIVDNDLPAPRVYVDWAQSSSGGFSLRGNDATLQEGSSAKLRVSLSRPSPTPVEVTVGVAYGFGLAGAAPGGGSGFSLTSGGQNNSNGKYEIPPGSLWIDVDLSIPENNTRSGDRSISVGVLAASTSSQVDVGNTSGTLDILTSFQRVTVKDNDAPSSVPPANQQPPIFASNSADGINFDGTKLQLPSTNGNSPGFNSEFNSNLITVGGAPDSHPLTLSLPLNTSNGFISGGTVFFDANRNGIADFLDLNDTGTQDPGEPSEPQYTTDLEGNFISSLDPAFDVTGDGTIDASEGRWMIMGGTDASKDLPLLTPMSAPAGMFVINGVSTLVNQLIEQHGHTLESGKSRVAEVFELSASDLGFLDNVRAASVNDQEGNRAVVANAQIMDTVNLISRMYASLPSAPEVPFFSQIAFAEIANLIAGEGSTIDLSNTSVQRSLIAAVEIETGFALPTPDADAAATVIAAGNGYLQTQLTEEDTSDLLENTVRAQIVAQTDVALALESLAVGTTDAATITASFTGAALQTLIDGTTPGTIIPPALVVRHAYTDEGNSGTSQLVFQVDLIGTSTQPVSVDYQTQDGTATVADGDYAPTSGTLAWAAGESGSQFVVVDVWGDTQQEDVEYISLIIDNELNSVVRSDVAYGYLVDDDISAVNQSSVPIEFSVVRLEPEPGVNTDYLTLDPSRPNSHLLLRNREGSPGSFVRTQLDVDRRNLSINELQEITNAYPSALEAGWYYVVGRPNGLFTFPRNGTGVLSQVANTPNARPLGTRSDGNQVFFAADDAFGMELWLADLETNAVTRLTDLSPGPGDGYDINSGLPGMLGDELYFSGSISHPTASRGLWKSDGTETVLVSDEVRPINYEPIELNGRLYFYAQHNEDWRMGGIWSTDGTPHGTYPVVTFTDVNELSIEQLVKLGDQIYFTTESTSSFTQRDYQLYRINPVTHAKELVLDSTNFHDTVDGPDSSDRIEVKAPVAYGEGFLYWEKISSSPSRLRLVHYPHKEAEESPSVLAEIEAVGNAFLYHSGISVFDEYIVFSTKEGFSAEPKVWVSRGQPDQLFELDTTLGSDYARGIGGFEQPDFGFVDANGKIFLLTGNNGEPSQLHTVIAKPSAYLGEELSIGEGSTLRLDTSLSRDVEDSVVSVEWDRSFTDGIFVADTIGDELNFTFVDGPSTQTVAMRLTDHWGNTSVATRIINVENVAPTIAPIHDLSSQLGESIAFSATVSDPGLDELTYHWDFDDGNTSSAVAPAHTYASEGEYFASLTVTDSDGAVTIEDFRVVVGPPVTVTASVSEMAEAETVTLTASLTAALSQEVVVPLTYTGTAEADVDFREVGQSQAPTSITIPAGQLTASVIIENREDSLDEHIEAMIVEIGVPANASLASADPIIVNLLDNDLPPRVFVSDDGRAVHEVEQSLPVTVSLSHPSGKDVVVQLATNGTAEAGEDYRLSDSLLVIPSGETSVITTLDIVDDELGEDAEQIGVEITSAQNAEVVGGGAFPASVLYVVRANDAPTLEFLSSFKRVSETAGNYSIDVALSNPNQDDITFNYTLYGSAVEDTDYALLSPSGSLTIPAGELTHSIEVEILDNNTQHSPKTLVARLTGATDAILGPTRFQSTQIVDDESLEIRLLASTSTIWEDENFFAVTASLNSPAPNSFSVPFSLSGTASEGSHYFASDTEFEFLAGEQTATVTFVLATDDSIYERHRTIKLRPSAPAEATLVDRSLLVSLRDNDPYVGIEGLYDSSPFALSGFGFSVETSAPNLGGISGAFSGLFNTRVREDAGEETIAIFLDRTTNRDVVVPIQYRYSTAERIDLGDIDTSIVIPAGQLSASLSVPIRDDLRDEARETFSVDIGNPTGAVRHPDAISRTIEIIDNDAPPNPYWVFPESIVREGDTQLLAVGIRLAGTSDQDVTANVTTGGTATRGQDYDLVDSEIMFAAGDREEVLYVVIGDDGDYEGLETIDLHVNTGGRVSTFTINLNDNDSQPRPQRKRQWWEKWGDEIQKVGNQISDGLKQVRDALFDIPNSVCVVPFLPDPFNPGQLRRVCGSAHDGYFDNATIFVDYNFNETVDFVDLDGDGTATEGDLIEVTTTSDYDGNFTATLLPFADRNADGTVDTTEAQLVSYGGVDVSTGYDSQIPLTAPLGYPVITPLTTLVAKQRLETADPIAEVEQRIANALSLPSINYLAADLIAVANQGDLSAAEAFSQSVQVYSTVQQIASYVSSLPDSPSLRLAGSLAFTDIASKLREDGAILDLTQPLFVESILQGTLLRAGMSEVSDPVAQDVAGVIVASNQAISDATGATGREWLEAIVKVQGVATNAVSQGLAELAAGDATISELQTQFTGGSLQSLIDAQSIGNVVAPYVVASDITIVEGDDGTSFAVFEVGLTDPSNLPVTVQFATSDFTATAGDDYTATTGSLTWQPGDVSVRQIQVPILGDSDAEADERFHLVLSDAVNAQVFETISYGDILSDDGPDISFSDTSVDHQLSLEATVAGTRLFDNGEVAFDGQFTGDEALVIRAADGVQTDLIAIIRPDAAVPAGGYRFIGSGATSSLTIDPSFATSIHWFQTEEGEQGFEIDNTRLSYDNVGSIMSPASPMITGLPVDATGFSDTITLVGTPPESFDPALAITESWSVVLDEQEVSVVPGNQLELTINDIGNYQVIYTATQDGRLAAVASYSFAVTNAPPVATNDNYTGEEDSTTLVDTAAGLLANDSDTSSGTISVTSIDGMSNVATVPFEFASATINPANPVSNLSLNDTNFYGVRFEVTETLDVDRIGGNFTFFSGTGPFGAIVSLESASDLPDSVDLTTPDVLATTIVPLAFQDDGDKRGDLDITLQPGWYALMFGTGKFGSTGITSLPVNNDPALTPNDYLHARVAVPEYFPISPANPTWKARFVLEGTTTQVVPVTLASGAIVTVSPDGSFTYDPNGQFESLSASATADDSFVYTVTDGEGLSATATATLTIQGANDAPIAVDDSYIVSEESLLSPAPSVGLLVNDSDVDSATLTVSEINGQAFAGTIVLASGATVAPAAEPNRFVYDPRAAFDYLTLGETATDSFTYQITDEAGAFSTATVTVTINGWNDAPELTASAPSLDVDEGTLASLTGTLIDPEGHVSFSSTLGDVRLDESTGEWTWRYEASRSMDVQTVTVTATDDNGSTAAVNFELTVLHVPQVEVVVDADGGTVDEATEWTLTAGYRDTHIELPHTLQIDWDDPSATELSFNLPRLDTISVGDEYLDATSSVTLTIDRVTPLTAEDEIVLQEINETGSAFPNSFFDAGDYALFMADDGIHGLELWKLDADGAQLVKDINPSERSLFSPEFTRLGDDVLFVANDGTNGFALWKTDGTSGGTTLVFDARTSGISQMQDLTAFDERIFFTALDESGKQQLWQSDGTTLGTAVVPLADSNATSLSSISELSVVGDTLFLRANQSNATGMTREELFAVDDANGSVRLVKDIFPGNAASWPSKITDVNGTAFFQIQTATGSNELWKSDGTDEGTVLVSEIVPGGAPAGAGLQSMTALGEILLFGVDDGIHGTELWRSDGTDAGTFMVADINPSGNGYTELDSGAPGMAVLGDRVYFQGIGSNGANDRELWYSDGTAAGTAAIEIRPGSPGSEPRHFTVLEDAVYFVARTPATGRELWKSDGTPEGTRLVQDRIPGSGELKPAELSTWQNRLLIRGFDSSNDDELYVYQVPETTGIEIQFSVPHTFDDDRLATGEANKQIQITASESLGGTDDASTSLTVTNVAPVATDDEATVSENGTSILISVLDNDSDVAEALDPLTLTSVDGASALGQVTLQGNQIQYTPAGQFEFLADGQTAEDLFTYTVADDDGGSTTGTVTVTIQGEVDPPQANDDNYVVSEDLLLSPALANGLLANDSDPEGTALNITQINGEPFAGVIQLPSGATVEPAAEPNRFVYDPRDAFNGLRAGEVGNDSFNYTIVDASGLSATATASITINGVNDAATISGELLFTTGEDTDIISASLSITDPDLDQASFVTQSNVTGAYGTFSIAENGTWSYDLNNVLTNELDEGESPTESFVVQSVDGSASRTIEITIVGAADTDTDGVDDTLEDEIGDGNSDGIPDSQQDNVASLRNAVTSSTVTLATSDGTSLVDVIASDPSLFLQQPPVDVQLPIGLVQFTVLVDEAGDSTTVRLFYDATEPVNAIYKFGPMGNDDLGYYRFDDVDFGIDEFGASFVDLHLVDGGVGDADGTANGRIVDPVGLALVPGLGDDYVTTNEDLSLHINALANDVLVAPVVIDSVTTPEFGTATTNLDGTITYAPNANFVGADSFTYTATDTQGFTGTATVFVSVLPANDAPTITLTTATGVVTEGSQAEATGTFGDLDTTSPLQLSASVGDIVDVGAGNWSWSHTPLNGPADSQQVELSVFDGLETRSVSFELTVQNVPVEFDAGADVSLTPDDEGQFARSNIGFTDPGHDTWTGSVDFGDNTGVQPLTIDSGSKQFDLIHTYTQEGTFTVTVSVSDGDSPATVNTFMVDVILNQAPIANDDTVTVGEDDGAIDITGELGVSGTGLLGNDLDPDGDEVAILSIDDSTLTRGLLTLSNGSVTYTPNGEFESLADGEVAHESFMYTIADPSGESSMAMATLEIVGDNDAPTITANSDHFTVDEAETAMHGGLIADIDTTDTLTLSASIGTVEDVGNGEWSWEWNTQDGPANSQTVTVTVSDGLVSRSTSFSLVVNNLPPTASLDSISEPRVEGAAITINGSAIDPAGVLDSVQYSYRAWQHLQTTVLGEDLIVNGDFEHTPPLTWSGQNDQPYEVFAEIPGWTSASMPGFLVHTARSYRSIDSLSLARELLNGRWSFADSTRLDPTINFVDTGDNGRFDADRSFDLNSPWDDNNFALSATGQVHVPHAGTWTFGTNSDDGVQLTIGGVSVIVDDRQHAAEDKFGTIELSAGWHDIELLYFERRGGATVELFASEGTLSDWSSSFRLLGDTENGGLEVVSTSSIEIQAGDHGTGVLDDNQVAELDLPDAVSNATARTLRQTVSIEEAGNYRLQLDVAKRNSDHAANGLQVYVSDVLVDTIQPETNQLVTYTFDLTLGTGNHVIELVGLSQSNTGSVVDNVKLQQVVHLDEWQLVAEQSPSTVSSFAFTPTDNGDYRIDLTATDKDGGQDTVTETFSVANAAPELSSLVSSHPEIESRSEDGHVTVSGVLRDAGTVDSHAIEIVWGDGTISELTSDNIQERQFEQTHHYRSGGIYTVTVRVIDTQGAETEQQTTAVVQGVGLVADTLYVIGTDLRDAIDVRERRGATRVQSSLGATRTTVDEYPLGDIAKMEFHLFGGHDSLSIRDHAGVVVHVDAGDGNDRVETDGTIDRVLAGAGDDVIDTGAADDLVIGGLGNDRVNAGRGNDMIAGLAGNDRLSGSDGYDLLIGGDGRDRIFGGDDDDLIVAGIAANEALVIALEQAATAWRNHNDVAAALAELGELSDDEETDHVYGNRGDDELFGNLGDRLRD